MTSENEIAYLDDAPFDVEYWIVTERKRRILDLAERLFIRDTRSELVERATRNALARAEAFYAVAEEQGYASVWTFVQALKSNGQ